MNHLHYLFIHSNISKNLKKPKKKPQKIKQKHTQITTTPTYPNTPLTEAYSMD